MNAAQTMQRALIDQTPCRGGADSWTSEDRDERALAARCCAGCRLLDLCAAVAVEIGPSFGVWHAHDYSPRHGGPHD